MAQATLPRPSLGWPLLPQPDADGCLSFPSLDDSVRQAIRVIVQTRPGEQLMRPDFGAGLSEFLHEPNTLTTRRRIRDVVSEALGRWEDRIVLDRVRRVDCWSTTCRLFQRCIRCPELARSAT